MVHPSVMNAGATFAFKHIEKSLEDGYKVVVVVSAMGRKGEPYATDTFLSLIGGADIIVSKREQDILIGMRRNNLQHCFLQTY